MPGMSFGQARDYLLDQLGGESVGDEARLELLMQAALVEISNELGLVREQRMTIDFDLTDGDSVFPLPADVSRIIELRINSRIIPQRDPYYDLEFHPPLGVNDFPSWWWEDLDTHSLVIEPEVDDDFEARLTYLATVDTTLYNVVSGSRVWNNIPLPEEVHPAFVEYVWGKALIDADPGLAAMKMNAAFGQIKHWKTHRLKSVRPRLVLNGDAQRRRKSYGAWSAWDNDASRFNPIYD